MNIIKQLTKEFFLPFLLSILWTIYNLTQKQTSITITGAINIFGPTFFLASWLIAQWYRVKKQQRIEFDLNSIEEKTKEMLVELEKKNKELISNINGGEGFCEFLISWFCGEYYIEIINRGQYALHDISLIARPAFEPIVLAEPGEPRPPRIIYSQAKIHRLLAGERTEIDLNLDLKNQEHIEVTIDVKASNGTTRQSYRAKKISGEWLAASRIVREGEAILENIHPAFPRNNLGEVDWDEYSPFDELIKGNRGQTTFSPP